MKSSLLFLPIIVILLSIIFSYPTKTIAEVATGNDWLGLFVVYTDAVGWKNSKNDTVGGRWLYTGSGGVGCSATPAGPFLAGNCTFNTPSASMNPGAYEFRLNANTIPGDNTLDAAMIAQSKVVWKPITMIADALDCPDGFNPRVVITWSNNLVGVTKIQVYRDEVPLPAGLVNPLPNSYEDNTILRTINYSWHIVAQTIRGATVSSNVIANVGCAIGGFPTPTITPQPWLKTSGGDVHVNQ